MKKAVAFTPNNARVFHGSVEDISHMQNVIVNPDLSQVEGIPPHHWKMNIHGKIVKMTDEEKAQRDEHHKTHGIMNDPEAISPPSLSPPSAQATHHTHPYWVAWASFFVGALSCYLAIHH